MNEFWLFISFFCYYLLLSHYYYYVIIDWNAMLFIWKVVAFFLFFLLLLSPFSWGYSFSLFIYISVYNWDVQSLFCTQPHPPPRWVKTDPCKTPLNVHMCYPPFLLLLWPIYQDILTLVFLHLTWNYCLIKKLLRVRVLPEIYCFYIIFIYTNLIHIYLNFYSLSLCFMSLSLFNNKMKKAPRPFVTWPTSKTKCSLPTSPHHCFFAVFFLHEIEHFRVFIPLSLVQEMIDGACSARLPLMGWFAWLPPSNCNLYCIHCEIAAVTAEKEALILIHVILVCFYIIIHLCC